jgi:hypothetical protein
MGLWPKGALGFMFAYVPPQSGLYVSDIYYHFGGSANAELRDGLVELGWGPLPQFAMTFAAKWEHDVDTTNTFKGDVVTVAATAAF